MLVGRSLYGGHGQGLLSRNDNWRLPKLANIDGAPFDHLKKKPMLKLAGQIHLGPDRASMVNWR